MKNIEELRESAIERIFLVPVSEDGELHYCWCDDPAPSEGMVASEAVEYVRADVVQMLRGQLEETQKDRDITRERLVMARSALLDAIDALWCNDHNSDARSAEQVLDEISDAIDKE